MINANEHKKLLAQIAELEKNSINYFDVEKEFFLITSDNLSQVRPKLYGYSIQQSGIYEDDNLTPEAIAGLDGRGCYVYVGVKDGEITIKQDLNGSWGIYLFRHGDYFALSNSFFRLLDHVKFKYPLTVNRDYVNYLTSVSLCSLTCPETAINEIQLIDRNEILHIDTKKFSLQKEWIDYAEFSVPLDSKKGIAILDNWVELWSNVVRGVAQYTKFLQADLSGGFDSRMSLVPILNSGIDLNKIRINSATGVVHTFIEDYSIASQIADHYGFKLNRPLPSHQSLNESLSDVFTINLHTKQTFSNLFAFSMVKNVDKIYHITGDSGETLRGRWHESPKKFMENTLIRANNYSFNLAAELRSSIQTIVESGFRVVCDKQKIKDINSEKIPQCFYYETWNRHHFGKGNLVTYFSNTIKLSPAIDPEIRTLKLETEDCPDPKLLMALLFTRYAPDLLTFPFNSNRSIPPETIAYAQKLNERFPRHMTMDKVDRGGGVFHLQPHDLQTEKILVEGKNNPNIPRGLSQACLKAMFESSRTYGLFTAYFDEELYHRAANYYDTHNYIRELPMYSIVGIARVLEDVEISQRDYAQYQDLKRFLERDFSLIDNKVKIFDNFKQYFTARIDIKFDTTTTGDFQILSVSDKNANIFKPAYFQKNGTGYVIQSYTGNLDYTAKVTTDGKIRLWLRGMWIPDPEDKSKRIPYWIDYTKLTVNDETILDTLTPTWHDKSYYYFMEVKTDEEIKIHIEWQPHRSDT